VRQPALTGSATAYWVAENGAITASTLTDAQKTLQPNEAAALVKASNQLLDLSNPSASSVIQEDITMKIAQLVDLAVLRGAGTSNEPRGVANTSSIRTVAASSAALVGGRIARDPRDDPWWEAFWEGLKAYGRGWKGTDKVLGRQVFEEAEFAKDWPEWGKTLAGLGLEIGADPTTYVGVGLVGKAGKGARLAATAASKGRLLDTTQQLGLVLE